MSRILTRAVLLVVVSFALSSLVWAQSASPPERLLPRTAKGVFLVANEPQLAEHWKKTQLGQLMADPVMEPFAKDLRRQFEERFSRIRERLGLELDDLKGVPGGGVAVALIQPAKDEAAMAILVDVTGHVPQAKALLEKVSANLTKQGAKRQHLTVQGNTVVVFDVPANEEYPAGKAAYFLMGDLLAASDNMKVMEDILKRRLGQPVPGGTLAESPAFQAVMTRCQKHAGEAVPQIRWFVEPLGYVETIRTATPEEKRRTGTTVLDVVQNQGFGAVQGVGGFIDLEVNGLEVIHRTAVYAPPPYPKAPPPYQDKVSMNLFVLPNHGQFAPPAWVPTDIAACTTFYWDVLKAFDNFGPMFDEMVGGLDFLFKMEMDVALQKDLESSKLSDALRKAFEKAEIPLNEKVSVLVEEPLRQWRILSGTEAYVIKVSPEELKVYLANTGLWADVLEGLKDDPTGPQIDLRNEIVVYLGQRVTLVTDYELPITPTSERLLFALEAKDEKALAAGIQKMYENDKTVQRRDYEGIVIWETVEDQRHKVPDAPVIDLPSLTPPKQGAAAPRPGQHGPGGGGQDLLPHKAVAVVHGHLLIASHYDFLVKILAGAKKPDPLTESIDYRVVQGAMEQLGVGENCLRAFSRTDEEYRPTYELIRMGKMPQSETMFGRLLNSLLGPRKRGAVRQQKLDGQELPDYQVVRRYLGPAGVFGTAEKDGWFLVGFMLKK